MGNLTKPPPHFRRPCHSSKKHSAPMCRAVRHSLRCVFLISAAHYWRWKSTPGGQARDAAAGVSLKNIGAHYRKPSPTHTIHTKTQEPQDHPADGTEQHHKTHDTRGHRGTTQKHHKKHTRQNRAALKPSPQSIRRALACDSCESDGIHTSLN